MDTLSLEISAQLFDDDQERATFVRSRIVDGRPSLDLIERAAEPIGLGPLVLRHDGSGEMSPSAALLLLSSDLPERRDAAEVWLRTMHGRDIYAVIVVYTLNEEQTDFASLEPFVADWFWERLPTVGERIHYEGLAYPIGFARGITFRVGGEHVIEDVIEEELEAWFEIRNLETGERVWVPMLPLLAGSPAPKSQTELR